MQQILYGKNVLIFGVIFSFIFSTRLNGLEPLHLGHMAVGTLLIANMSQLSRVSLPPRNLLVFIHFMIFLAIYHAGIALLYAHNPSYFSSICISNVVYILFGYLLARTVARFGISAGSVINYLIVMISLAIALNSTVAIVETLSPSFKLFVESFLVNDVPAGVLSYADHPFVVRGLSAAGGAGLSVLNALTIVLLTHLTLKRKVNPYVTVLLCLIVLSSTIYIGRTGLIFALLFACLLLVSASYVLWQSRRAVSGVVLLVGLIFAVTVASPSVKFELDPQVQSWAFDWYSSSASELFSNASTEELWSSYSVPENPLVLLFGAGFFDGQSSYVMRSDSGYLKTILSVGVIFGSLMYLAIVSMFSRLVRVSREYRLLVFVTLTFLLVIEVKEPFMYQNFVARVISLLSGAALFVQRFRPA